MTFLVRLAAAFALSLQAAAADDPKPTIAVMDFAASNVPAGDAVIVSGFVRAAVIRCGKFVVVEKNNMDKVLAEQAFQQTGCTTSECAVKMGKLLNARKMVVGEFALLGGVRFLAASLVDVETGQLEATARVKGFEVGTADEAADRLVGQLTGVAVTPGSDVMGRASRPPRSYPRFGIGVGGNSVGYDQRFRLVQPWGGIHDKVQPHTDGEGGLTAGLRMPVAGGRASAGLDAAFGIWPGSYGHYESFPVLDASGKEWTFFSRKISGWSDTGIMQGGDTVGISYGVTGVFVFGIGERLGLKAGLGFEAVRLPALRMAAFPELGSMAPSVSLRELPARTRVAVLASAGLEWFMGTHMALDLQAIFDANGGGELDAVEDNGFGVKFDPLRFGFSLKYYL